MRLAFLVAPDDPAFLTDVFTAILTRAERHGVGGSVISGPLGGLLDASTTPVVSWRRLARRERELEPLWHRTILFGTEELGYAVPGSGPELGHRFELSRHVVRSSRFNGVDAEWFDLPYVSEWEHAGAPDPDARPWPLLCPVDAEPGHHNAVARLSGELADIGATFHVASLTPDARADAHNARVRRSLLARSRAALISRGTAGSGLSRLRALEAIANGAAVVGAAGGDWGFLKPGQHVLLANPPYLGAVVRAAVTDLDRLSVLAVQAREIALERAQTNVAVERLCTVAETLLPRAMRSSTEVIRAEIAPLRKPRWPETRWVFEPASVSRVEDAPQLDPWLPPGVQVQLGDEAVVEDPEWEPRAAWSPRVSAGTDAVDVICVAHARSGPIGRTALSLAELGSAARLKLAVGRSFPRPPAGLGIEAFFRTDEDETVGRVRNALLAQSHAEYVLVIDAGDTLLPGALAALRGALEDDREAVVATTVCAYGTAALTNVIAPDHDLLLRRAYLSRGYLVRRSWLDRIGGLADDEDFDALVDHEFWLRTTDLGGKICQLPMLGMQLWSPELTD